MAVRTIMTLVGGAALALATPHVVAETVPGRGGTIAVTSPAGADPDDTVDRAAREAASASLGEHGFTILPDSNHAAYVAEVIATQSDVGTSMTKGRRAAPAVMGAGVNIPLGTGKSSFVAMQRTTIEIRIRRRGADTVLWQGAAVTVRPAAAARATAERLAVELSQAALGSYPTVTGTSISIP